MSALASHGGVEEVVDGFVAKLNRGDLRAANAYLARDACLVTPDGTAIHGREEVRRALDQVIAIGLAAELDLRTAITVGEVALVSDRWTIAVGSGDPAGLRQTARGTVVLSLVEGRWKVVLAAPWGWADKPLGLERPAAIGAS